MRKFVLCGLAAALMFSSPLVAKTKKGKAKAEAKPAAQEEVSAPAEDGKELHSFSRLINFDAHPPVIEPLASPLSYGGKKVSYTVESIEKWDTKSPAPNLKELGFKIVLTADGKELKTLEVALKALDVKKMKKGDVLAKEKFENLGVKLSIDEFHKSGKCLTDISIAGKLLGYGPDTSEAAPTEAGAPVPPVAEPVAAAPAADATIALHMAQQLAKRGDEMAEANVTGKIALYKKALGYLDEKTGNPDVLALATGIKEKIAKLETQPVIAGARAPVAVSKTTPEVQAFYDEAVKKFNSLQEPEGRELLRKAVEKDPNFYAGWALMAKNAMSNTKYAKAKEAAEKALGLKDDDVDSGVIYFKSCYYLGESETGLEKLSGIAKRYPTKYEAQYALAEAYFQAGDLPACEEQCLKITNAFKGNDRVKDLLAKVKEKMK